MHYGIEADNGVVYVIIHQKSDIRRLGTSLQSHQILDKRGLTNNC